MADGRCIFQGDTAAMVPYLQSIGVPCPRHYNPADFSESLFFRAPRPTNNLNLCQVIV